MYVVNPEVIDESKLYHCNGIIANFLIYEQHMPLFGRCPKGGYYFARNEKLEKVLKNLPMWMKIFAPKYP